MNFPLRRDAQKRSLDDLSPILLIVTGELQDPEAGRHTTLEGFNRNVYEEAAMTNHSLCDTLDGAPSRCGDWIKIGIQRRCCRLENQVTVLALVEVSFDFTCNRRCELTF